MSYLVDQRKYQRRTSTVCKALLSLNRKHWVNVELLDISAGGLRFASDRDYSIDTKLFFDLSVYNMLSEFNLKLEGSIVRKEIENGTIMHAVKFNNINSYTQVQLDELLKSRISIRNMSEPANDDGTYTFMLMPRTRTRKTVLYR